MIFTSLWLKLRRLRPFRCTGNKKSRRDGTPEGIRPRRLTRQRAPRHGRVALYLVIRRFRWEAASDYAGTLSPLEFYAAEPKMQ